MIHKCLVGCILIGFVLISRAGVAEDAKAKVHQSSRQKTNSPVIRKEMTYQGYLTDDQQAPVTGVHTLTFRFFESEIGGSPLWSEVHENVMITAGLFQVFLGSVNELDLPFNIPYWLSIQVDDGPELAPRMRITSVAASIHSLTAELAANIADGIVTSEKIADGAILPVDLGFSVPTFPVGREDLADSAVSREKLADNAVSSEKIADGAILPVDLGFSVPTFPVGREDLADSAVSREKLADNAVSSEKIADGAILPVDLGFSVPAVPIATGDIADGAVTGGKVADGAINSAHLTDGAVSAGKIADGAITTAKIALSAVSSDRLSDEPGLAHSASGSGISVGLSGITNITSQIITVPGPGYIVARGTGHAGLTGTILGDVLLGIDTAATAFPAAPDFSAFGSDGELLSVSLTRWGALVTERIFPVANAGTYEYFLNATRGSSAAGSATIWYGKLTLLYFPTAYGGVTQNMSVSGSSGARNDGAPLR